MRRFRVPELVLGVLLATAVWAVVFAINPKYSGTQQQSQATSNNQPHEVSEAEKADERLARYTLWLTIFTGVLAISTIGLWIVTWRSGVRQSSDMQTSIKAANLSAKAAERAADVAERALVLTDRPWIKIDVDLAGSLEFGRDEITLPIHAVWKNIGKSPATNFFINFALHEDIAIAAGRLHQYARNMVYIPDLASPVNTGITLFPNEDGWADQRLVLKRSSFLERLSDLNSGHPPLGRLSGLNLAVSAIAYYRIPSEGSGIKFRCSSVLLELNSSLLPNGFDGNEITVVRDNLELAHTMYAGPMT